MRIAQIVFMELPKIKLKKKLHFQTQKEEKVVLVQQEHNRGKIV